jgi:hypothetical protein
MGFNWDHASMSEPECRPDVPSFATLEKVDTQQGHNQGL